MVPWQLLMRSSGVLSPFRPKFVEEKGQLLCSLDFAVLTPWIVGVKTRVWMIKRYHVYWTGRYCPFVSLGVK